MEKSSKHSKKNNDILVFKLEDEKILSLAQSLQNGTAKLIINLLQDDIERSQKMIVDELKLPKASVYYAINLLKKGRIIKTSRKELSKKGREISFYTLNPKPIVICPKPQSFLKEFSTIIPTAFLFTAITAISYIFFSKKHNSEFSELASAPITATGVPIAAKTIEEEPEIMADTMMFESSRIMNETITSQSSSIYSVEQLFIGFLLGGIFCLIMFLVYRWFKLKKV